MLKTGDAARAEALSSLASRNPKDLLIVQGTTGKRLLHHVYQQCCISGLIAVPRAEDDVQRLHALFDLAQQHGLASVVVDYILEVCSDETLTSSDPVDAFLMDGECVSVWLNKTLNATVARVKQALGSDFSVVHSQIICEEIGRINCLIYVSKTLEPQAVGSQSSNYQTAIRLKHCTKVAAWLIQEDLHRSRHSGRYASRQEWVMTDKKRRDACLRSTFLQDAIKALEEFQVPTNSLHYPPESLGKAIGSLFLTGSASEAAFKAKLCVFLYVLLDSGQSKALSSFGRAFGLSEREVSQQHVLFLLDESLLKQPGNLALETACAILPEVAGSEMPFKVVEVLAAAGKPATAIRVWDACSWSSQTSADLGLHNSRVAIGIMLECGLTSKALIEISRHSKEAGPGREEQDTQALIGCLAEWASKTSKLAELVRLPFQQKQEQALLKWLREEAGIGHDDAGTVLVLYHLQRQQYIDALSDFETLRPVSDPRSKAAVARECVVDLLLSANQLLPESQKRMILPKRPTFRTV